MAKTPEEKIAILKEILIKLIHSISELTWTQRDYLTSKLDEIEKD